MNNMNTEAMFPSELPPQTQRRPGDEDEMMPKPLAIRPDYKSAGKLAGRFALITGGDSGIGRAVAYHFAAEGADICINYLNEDSDAEETSEVVKSYGRECYTLAGDVGDPSFSHSLVKFCITRFGALNIVVNNAAEQHVAESIADISAEQLERTFRTNFYSYFYVAQAAAEVLQKGDTIINTTSITAYRGSAHLLDYSATKGAIVTFTRSLASQLAPRGIRVNAVAPGPIWTPLIPSSFPAGKVAEFGSKQLMERPGQPCEVAPAYVYLASDDSSYMTGQVLHPNGGEIVNT